MQKLIPYTVEDFDFDGYIYTDKIEYPATIGYSVEAMTVVAGVDKKSYVIKVFNGRGHRVTFTDSYDLTDTDDGRQIGVFIVENSEFLEWFNSENYGFMAEKFIHILISTVNAIIDIVYWPDKDDDPTKYVIAERIDD